MTKYGLGILASLMTAGILGYATYTLITLNREVGQLSQSTQETSRRIEDMQKNAARTEDRFENELRRLRDRLEDVRDRVQGRSRPSKGAP